MRGHMVRISNHCYVCGKERTSLCDATREDGNACNAPMCNEHSCRVDKDVDVCGKHNNPRSIKEAKENRAIRADAMEYFEEVYSKQDFAVVPGHWPDFKNRKEVDDWIDMEKKMIKAVKELFDGGSWEED